MIYVFGDSFSEPFSKTPEIPYCKYKNYFPKQYYDYLGEERKEYIINKSKGGASNDYIFNEFMNIYGNILDDDIVIFGWSSQTRFEFVDRNLNEWVSSSMGYERKSLSNKTIEEMIVNRSHYLYMDQFHIRISFINNILKGKKVIHWSWVKNIDDYTITKETNGVINDFHYGEYGHRKLYEILSDGIKNSNLFKFNLPLNGNN
jgi:hypothetical protein